MKPECAKKRPWSGLLKNEINAMRTSKIRAAQGGEDDAATIEKRG